MINHVVTDLQNFVKIVMKVTSAAYTSPLLLTNQVALFLVFSVASDIVFAFRVLLWKLLVHLLGADWPFCKA